MKTLDPFTGIAAFLAVADTLSFSKAAEELALARTTVSAQVQDLEKRLGVRLLQRTTRSVALTEAGQAYRDALGGVVPQIREAERAAASYQQETVGRLRMSVAPDFAPDHVIPVVTEFLSLNPRVTVDLDLSMSAANLVEGGFDLAIRGTLSVESNLVVRRLCTAPIVLSASPAYLAKFGTPTHPEQLSEHACLHFSPLSWGHVWHFRAPGAQDEAPSLKVPITPRLSANEGRSLIAAAVNGAGIVLEPLFGVSAALRQGQLVRVLPDWSLVSVPIYAVYPANRHIARKVRSFVSLLVTRLAEDPELNG